MKKSDLESQIIDSKEENLRFKRALELLEGAQYNNPFKPSEYDVEVWEKYGERWLDPKMIKKYGQIIQRSWKRLDWRDWINFYKWLIQWKNISIERLELEMKKIMKNSNDKKIHHNPAPILKLFDYIDKENKPLSTDKKIELIQKTIRVLIRKDHSSEESIKRTQAITAYQSELEYLKGQKEEKDQLDTIINIAIKPIKKKNKKRAKEFMDLYAKMRDTNPHYNPTDFVDEIDWVEPTPNTQKDWMEKFDEAEKMLSISN